MDAWVPTLKNFIDIVQERGFFYQATHMQALQEAARSPLTAYIGFDCTAPSLHVGSLMQIMLLRWLQKCGHTPIVLMGGGTTKIGDPSGKDEARKMLGETEIQANMQGIKSIFSQFIDFESPHNPAIMVNNDDWLSRLNYVDFLRDYGKHFSVNRMLAMDSVNLRLEREQNLSFLEFNYMVFQAYDFVELNKRYGCRLQIGGSDQWGNIVNGVELHRRLTVAAGTQADCNPAAAACPAHEAIFGLTTPLVTTASGTKMGKTANGAVWLNKEQLSPYDYWQYWRNTEDADVRKFLLLFTELPVEEIDALARLEGAPINEAKKKLAWEATRLCHGEEAAIQAAETARQTFEEGNAGGDLKTLFLTKAELETGIPAFELLHKAGMRNSKGEAKKLIEAGGVKVNDEKITDFRTLITQLHLGNKGYIKLTAGKKNHLLVKIGGSPETKC